MKKMMMRMLVAVLLAMVWFGETHANPIVVGPRRSRHYVTVKFDANGGTVDAPSIRLHSGEAIRETFEEERLPIPKRDGYMFVGWYTERTGGWKITPYSTISTSERGKTATLYAHWRTQANPIYVKFDANGGTVDVPSIRRCYEENIGRLPTPKRHGYSFTGWYTEQTGGWKITPGSVISTSERDETVTVYAHWSGKGLLSDFDDDDDF